MSRQSGLVVRGISVSEEAELIERISSFRPDVIVWASADDRARFNRLFDLLVDYPRLREVILSLDGARMQIHDRCQVAVQGASELVKLIACDCQSLSAKSVPSPAD